MPATKKRTSKSPAAVAARIAREVFAIETLETQHSDNADFHELAVWNIERALMAAYEAGRLAAK